MKFLLPIFSGVLLTFSAQSQVQIMNEDFSAGIPSTWTIAIADTNHVDSAVSEFAPGWIGLVDPLDNTNFIAGATSYFVYAAAADRWLITPSVQLGAYGNVLKWRSRSHDPSHPENFQIRISTTDTQISSFTDTLAVVNLEFEDWTEHEVNISAAGYNSQNVYIAFVLKTFDGFKFYVDDVNLRKDDPLTTNEISASNISVYPNPANGSFSIKGASGSLKLISLTGAVVMEKMVSENEKIDISSLNSGTYIAEIASESVILRTRLVKK